MAAHSISQTRTVAQAICQSLGYLYRESGIATEQMARLSWSEAWSVNGADGVTMPVRLFHSGLAIPPALIEKANSMLGLTPIHRRSITGSPFSFTPQALHCEG